MLNQTREQTRCMPDTPQIRNNKNERTETGVEVR
jgi:hypothetical protein